MPFFEIIVLRKVVIVMSMKLVSIIEKETGKTPTPSSIAKFSGLAISTTNDALNREVSKTSFGTVVKILKAAEVSVEKVAELYATDEVDPARVEGYFLSQTDLKKRRIMDIQFSSSENFWKARDTILNTIYEGFYPKKNDVYQLMERLEHKTTSNELISQLRETYAKES